MNLLQYRTELGLSLEQTAVALGLKPTSKGWISEIENGKKDASIRLALRIERWSGGRVAAATHCRELAVDHGSLPGGDDATEAQPDAGVPLAKSGALQ